MIIDEFLEILIRQCIFTVLNFSSQSFYKNCLRKIPDIPIFELLNYKIELCAVKLNEIETEIHKIDLVNLTFHKSKD